MSDIEEILHLRPSPCTITDEGVVEGWDPTPGTKHYMCAEISQFHLDKYGEFDYFRGVKEGKRELHDAESLWIGAMQKYLRINTVWLMTEDLDEGIFLFSTFMGSTKMPFFLGKLRETCVLYPIAEKAFREFAEGASQ